MQKALRLHKFSGPSGLKIDELPIEEPSANEVRIKVSAFGLNYGDLALMHDDYPFSLTLPSRLGDECCGTIDAIGSEVTQFKVGDKVSTLPWMNDGYGVDGEYTLMPEQWVVPTPTSFTTAEASSFWINYTTAYYPIFEVSKLGEGDYIIVTAATGAAGMAAIDMAKLAGAKVIATSRTASNIEFLLANGADYVVVTDSERIDEKVNEITDGIGAKAIYDPIGGPLIEDYIDALAYGGTIYLYGLIDTRPTPVPIIKLNQKNGIIRSYSVYHHIYDEDKRNRCVKFLTDKVNEGKLKPPVDKVVSFDNYMEAFEYQMTGSRSQHGKIVVTMD